MLYEGQIIYTQQDYLKGHLLYFNEKLTEIKNYRHEYNEMRQQLISLFKDPQLSEELRRASPDAPVDDSRVNRPNNYGSVPPEHNSLMASVIQNETRNGLRIVEQDYGRGNALSQSHVISLRTLSAPQNYDPFPSTHVAWSPLLHILFYVNLGMLASSFFVNWHRASFLSLIVSIIFSTWYLLKEDFERLLPPIAMLISYFLTLTFDLVWLFEDSGHVWSSGMWIHSSSLAGMDKFMVIMSYILVGFEVAAVAISLLLHLRGIFAQKSGLDSERIVKSKI